MIVNVRGTHGSGKSTLVRSVLRSLPDAIPVWDPTRRRRNPVGYRSGELSVVGPYVGEEAGGCDSLSAADVIFPLVAQWASTGDVLFEGITAQHSTGRLVELAKTRDVHVVLLATPLEECVSSVEARRAARGQGPFNMENVAREARIAASSCERLRGAGVAVETLGRAEALARVRQLLRLD